MRASSASAAGWSPRSSARLPRWLAPSSMRAAALRWRKLPSRPTSTAAEGSRSKAAAMSASARDASCSPEARATASTPGRPSASAWIMQRQVIGCSAADGKLRSTVSTWPRCRLRDRPIMASTPGSCASKGRSIRSNREAPPKKAMPAGLAQTMRARPASHSQAASGTSLRSSSVGVATSAKQTTPSCGRQTEHSVYDGLTEKIKEFGDIRLIFGAAEAGNEAAVQYLCCTAP